MLPAVFAAMQITVDTYKTFGVAKISLFAIMAFYHDFIFV